MELSGIQLDAVTRDYIVERVDGAIARDRQIWLTFVNAAILVTATRDAEARRLLEMADYRLCDGMGLMYASRLLRMPLPEMVSGPYLLFRLLKHACDHRYAVYLLGSTREVISEAVARVKAAHRELVVAGYHSGYFGLGEERAVVAGIRRSEAQLLFVGMGFPRERAFIQRWRTELNVPVIMDVGGAFMVLAGIHRLAPRLIRVLGMEWAYRMAQEPRRLWKRYLVTNSLFACLVCREMVRVARGQRSSGCR